MPSDTSKRIGARIRALREERGLTQRDLASPGVSYAYISRLEQGERRASVRALRQIAARLGVTAAYLETGLDDPSLELAELVISKGEGKRITSEAVEMARAVRRAHRRLAKL